MKRPLLITIATFLFLIIFFDNNAQAQSINDSSATKDSVITDLNTNDSASEPDDEFNIFLLVLGTVFMSIMIGGAIVGAFAATLVLLSLFGLASVGILSVSVITGLYKRSFQAGFKTFLIIVCSVGGILFGTVGFWLVVKLFELKMSAATTFISGAVSGALGGVMLGIVVYKLILISTKFFKRRLNFS